MSKIGRNDPCPCGSGKKYKNCCMHKDSDTNFTDITSANSFISQGVFSHKDDDNIHFLQEYNNIDILSIIGYLQIVRENHGKNNRLEWIAYQLLSSNNGCGNKSITSLELASYFKNHFTYNHQEDPPENLFTANIMTPIGNRIVFPGLSEGQVYFLQLFINAISLDKLDKSISKKILSQTFLLLSISNHIAKTLGYERNMQGISTTENFIYVPNYLQNNCVKISEDELDQLASEYNGDVTDISQFIFDPEKDKWDGVESDMNPIIHKPIIFDKGNNDYIVVSPTNLIFAAFNSILRKAQDLHKFDYIIKLYAKFAWDRCNNILSGMKYHLFDYKFDDNNLPIYEKLFSFDINKIAYVIFYYDDGQTFDTKCPFDIRKDTGQVDEINEHIEEQLKSFNTDKKLYKNSFMTLVIHLGIGRFTYIDNSKYELHNYIAISLNDLEALFQSRKCDQLTLWYFLQASQRTKLHSPFFMDNMSYFLEHEESFYSSDDVCTPALFVGVGYSCDFIVNAVQNFDTHLIKTIEGKYIPVSRENFLTRLPIYTTKIWSIPFFATTDSLGADIRVRPQKTFITPDSGNDSFVSEVCISIVYWLYVLSSHIMERFSAITLPLDISVGHKNNISCNYENIDSLNADLILQNSIKITRIGQYQILIETSADFLCGTAMDNNLAERILINKILFSIYHIYWSESGKSENVINYIMKEYFPISNRKKILTKLTNDDIRMAPIHVGSLRYTSNFALNNALDHLGEILSPKPYIPIDTLNQKERVKLINKIVDHFYFRLRDIINRFNQHEVMKCLLGSYEASIQKREKLRYETIPIIECYKDYSDIYSIIEKGEKDNTEISIALRCLIEHISAESCNGNESLDITSYDSCIAYMIHIINWGFVSDSINFNIADTKISLLKSGRVGTDKEFDINVLFKYRKSKMHDNYYYIKNNFSKMFSLSNKGTASNVIDHGLDKAFNEEFGVSYYDYIKIMHTAINVAYSAEESVCEMSIKEFTLMQMTDNKIERNTIEKFLSSFCLYNRGTVENVKSYGYKNIDFYPWRYNRQLSLLRRPIIKYDVFGEQFLMFGARTTYDSAVNLTSLIIDGRYLAKSKTMKSFLSKMNNNNGKKFNNEVYTFLNKKLDRDNYIVKKEIGIKPTGILKNYEDLGDIDIIVMDKNRKCVVNIECKYINDSRTPYEMFLELGKFINGDDAWIAKVDKRNKWISEHKKAFTTFGINNIEQFQFAYIFLTNESISMTFISKNDIKYKFITYISLQEDINILWQNLT